MWSHFLNLLYDSWIALVTATSTNTLGFVLWTLAITIASWCAVVAEKAWRLTRERHPAPIRTAFSASLAGGVSSVVLVSALVVLAFSVSVFLTVYHDHEAMVATNKQLRKDLDKANAPPPPHFVDRNPLVAANQVERVKEGLRKVLEKKKTVTFLVSWSPDLAVADFVPEFETLLSYACRSTPRQCWFAQSENGRNLERPPLPTPTTSGITIHGQEAADLAYALSDWFETHSVSSVPPKFKTYKGAETQHLFWIEIGPGSPWKK